MESCNELFINPHRGRSPLLLLALHLHLGARLILRRIRRGRGRPREGDRVERYVVNREVAHLMNQLAIR